MAKNPIAHERVIRVEVQTLYWLAGVPLHNGQTKDKGECTPDFSRCNPSLLTKPDERIKLALKKLRDNLVEHLRSNELDDGEELDLESQELLIQWIETWFDDLAFDSEVSP